MPTTTNASLPLNVAEMNMPVYAVCKQAASGRRAPPSIADIQDTTAVHFLCLVTCTVM